MQIGQHLCPQRCFEDLSLKKEMVRYIDLLKTPAVMQWKRFLTVYRSKWFNSRTRKDLIPTWDNTWLIRSQIWKRAMAIMKKAKRLWCTNEFCNSALTPRRTRQAVTKRAAIHSQDSQTSNKRYQLEGCLLNTPQTFRKRLGHSKDSITCRTRGSACLTKALNLSHWEWVKERSKSWCRRLFSNSLVNNSKG